MLCVVIPTLNVGEGLKPLLRELAGHVDRIVIADGGSDDDSLRIAVHYDAVFANGQPGRGHQLARGCDWRGGADWLLILHADTILPRGWKDAVAQHMSVNSRAAGYFKFGADGKGMRARMMEFWVGLRCSLFTLPYGDQGLLLPTDMYKRVGGYPQTTLFEDVAIVQAIKEKYGADFIQPMTGQIRTDISAYYRDGFWRRGVRNLRLARRFIRGDSADSLAAKYK